MSEFDLIANIQRRLSPNSPRVVLGIGDDAAVIASMPQAKMLFCTDMSVEGVHFELAYASAEDVGYRAVASCLSDLAAMGGRPTGVAISLAVPSDRQAFIDSFYRGVETLRRDLAESSAGLAVDIVGGDLSRSRTDIVIDVACLGETEAPILRSGARPGDLVCVSGTPGASAAGLALLQSRLATSDFEPLTRAHLRPRPRFDLLDALRLANPNALIDISDGLASEATHLARASGVSMVLDESRLPIHPLLKRAAEATSAAFLHWILHGGEDYELLCTIPAGASVPKGFTQIGAVEASTPGQPDVTLVKTHGERIAVLPLGYDHFG